MVNTDKLRGIMAEKRLTQGDVAKILGVTPKTMYKRMSKGVFGSDEIMKLIVELQIEDPMEVFFAPEEGKNDSAVE